MKDYVIEGITDLLKSGIPLSEIQHQIKTDPEIESHQIPYYLGRAVEISKDMMDKAISGTVFEADKKYTRSARKLRRHAAKKNGLTFSDRFRKRFK